MVMTNWRVLLISVSILTLSIMNSGALPLALADEDCSPIRLDDPGYSMEHVQVRDQKLIGDCYAEAAAQIYDAWRFLHHSKYYERQSSGFEINLRYKIDHRANDIDAGYLVDVIPMISKDGTCDQNEINHRLFKNNTNVDTYAEGIVRIHNSERDAFAKTTTGKSLSSAELKQINDHYLETEIQKLKAYNDQNLRYNLYDSEFEADVRRFDLDRTYTNPVEVFDALGIISCDTKITMAAHPLHYKHALFHNWYRPQGAALRKIHAALDRKEEAMPVGITYCSKVLKQGKAYRYQGTSDESQGGEVCGRHESLVIGRRMGPVSHKCELLVRNSWGKTCHYAQDLIPNCEAEKGSVWIDQDLLESAIFAVQTSR